jgi:hypothetical protein
MNNFSSSNSVHFDVTEVKNHNFSSLNYFQAINIFPLLIFYFNFLKNIYIIFLMIVFPGDR